MAKQRVNINQQQYADRWESGMNSSVQKMVAGVQAVTESPTQKAAQNSDKWLQGIQRAHANGRYVNGCNRVTVDEWKRVTSAKIQTNLTAGVSAAKPKVVAVAGQLISHINSGLPTVNAMPKVTMQDSVNKVVAWMQHMASFQRQ